MYNSILLDNIVQNLKKEKEFESMVSSDLNGNYFSAVDVVIPNSDGKSETYRIVIVKHNQQKSFT